MSQRKKNRARRNDVDDDSEDETFEATQSQSQGFTQREVDKLAGQVCNLLLVGEMKKIPVKSADIRKCVIQKKNRSSFQSVMDKAALLMDHVFGYKIVCLKSKSYIVVNTLSDKLVKYQHFSPKEEAEWGVLIVTLVAIFMSEGKMTAGSLESYLRILEVDITGDGKSMIQDFIRKKYLDTTIEDSSDPPTTMYMWGERAEATFSKKGILEFACKVYGSGMKPSMWAHQWKLVNGNDGQVEEAV